MKIKDIKTGDLLFLSGESKLAEQIKKAQRDRNFVNWHLNHVGWFIWINGELCVAEEDYPGVFDINRFQTQYVDKEADVYVGKIQGKSLSEDDKEKLLLETLSEASKNKLTNYAFLDILSFKANSLIYKWFGKDIWIGRKKNKHDRYTCSQRTCKYLQDYHGLMTDINYINAYPAQIADDENIKVKPINY